MTVLPLVPGTDCFYTGSLAASFPVGALLCVLPGIPALSTGSATAMPINLPLSTCSLLSSQQAWGTFQFTQFPQLHRLQCCSGHRCAALLPVWICSSTAPCILPAALALIPSLGALWGWGEGETCRFLGS